MRNTSIPQAEYPGCPAKNRTLDLGANKKLPWLKQARVRILGSGLNWRNVLKDLLKMSVLVFALTTPNPNDIEALNIVSGVLARPSQL